MARKISNGSMVWLFITLVFLIMWLITLTTAPEREDPALAGYPAFDFQSAWDGAGSEELDALLDAGITTLRLADGPHLADAIARAERRGGGRLRYAVILGATSGSAPATDPAPAVDALLGILREAGVVARASVQSFDWRALARVREAAPEVLTVYLTSETPDFDTIRRGREGTSPWTADQDVDTYDGSLPEAIRAAGGRIWGPRLRDLRPSDVEEAHRLGLKLLVWTVDEAGTAAKLLNLGVDGLVTDGPARLRPILVERSLVEPAP